MAMGVWTIWLALAVGAEADEPALAGYASESAFFGRLQSLDAMPNVAVISIGKSARAKPISVVVIGEDDPTRRPAILIMGNVASPHIVGSEIALGMAEWFAQHAHEEPVKRLLERVTLYVLPRPDPDGADRFFTRPYREADGNRNASDDDRDFRVGEDPPEDLNGDGAITVMRVADPTGAWIAHPSDARLLVKADMKKGEIGAYRLYVEGIDNDGDDEWNEDASDGTAFNRNFPAKYAMFTKGSGPHAVSEAETRAVADFLFDHPNVAAVLCFSPEDNMFHPAKPGGDEKIRTTIQAEDSATLESILEWYRTKHGGKDAPDSPAGAGSFADWAYLQYGRWTFACRSWWPGVAMTQGEESKPAADEGKADNKEEKKEKIDDREAWQLAALKWFDAEKIDGFVPWTPIEHPDFPGKRVEVGGFRPFVLLNPPATTIPLLVEKHVAFVQELGQRLPSLAVEDFRVVAAGEGVYRIEARIANTGFLPTASKMGQICQIPYPVLWELRLPEGATLAAGYRRGQIPFLNGGQRSDRLEWLVTHAGPMSARLSVVCPAAGSVDAVAEGGGS